MTTRRLRLARPGETARPACRSGHYFRRLAGVWTCLTCGAVR